MRRHPTLEAMTIGALLGTGGGVILFFGQVALGVLFIVVATLLWRREDG
jgi:hypothetical protein